MNKDRLKRIILLLIYVIVFIFSYIFASKGRFSTLHVVNSILIAFAFIQGSYLIDKRVNNSVFFRYLFFVLSLSLLWYLYINNVYVYLGYYLALIFLTLILLNWHYLLDKRSYDLHMTSIWIGIFLYALVGFFLVSRSDIVATLFINVSIGVISFAPLIYYIKFSKDIMSYRIYQKSIIVFVVISFIVNFLIYYKFYNWRNYKGLPIFIIIVSIHFIIQNTFLIYDRILNKEMAFFIVSNFIFALLYRFSVIGEVLAVLFISANTIVNLLYNFGVINLNGQDGYYRLYRSRLQQLMDEDTYNKEIADYFHDDILQDIIYIKKSLSNDMISKDEANKLLDELIISIRDSIGSLSPSIISTVDLKENIWIVIEAVADRYKDKQILFDFYCPDDLYLDNPYDILCLRIVKELVNNIYKHTNSTFAEISIKVRDEWLFITSVNNEGNFDKEKYYRLNRFSGLKQIERNVTLLGGSIEINNENGVTIDIMIPLDGRVVVEDSIS